MGALKASHRNISGTCPPFCWTLDYGYHTTFEGRGRFTERMNEIPMMALCSSNASDIAFFRQIAVIRYHRTGSASIPNP